MTASGNPSGIATTIIDTHKIIISIICPDISLVGFISILLVWLFISISKISWGSFSNIPVIIDSNFESFSYSFNSIDNLTPNLINKATKVTIPADKPKYPISSAILSNFNSKGVWLFSWALNTVLLIIPFCEWSPTAKTIAFPLPSIQWVPDSIIGEGTFSPLFLNSWHFWYDSFFIASDSPVKALSSIFIPFPSTKIKSAATTSP